jgi:methylmalonyl-CoA/ethylmalonyl-CoA epimerase
MAIIKKINHVAIAVADMESAITFWRDTMGIELSHVEEVPSQKATVAFFPVGESEIELVHPTSDDTGVARFLAKNGPGMHHLCLEVDDIEEKLNELKSKNVQLLNETPLVLEGRKMAFIHPKSTNGVLIELYEITKKVEG